MKRIFTILSLGAVLMTTSCKEWLDINTNPNYIADADMSMLMPTIQLFSADKLGYELTLYGSFWSQYVVQCSTTNQYYTVMTYDVTNSTFTSPWTYYYASILPRIKEVLAKAAEAKNASNYTLEAKAMLAHSLYILTSLYDEVAYSEGYIVESQTPHFDKGKDIQEVIIAICEEIRTMDQAKVAEDESVNLTSSSDMIFGGDTDAWFQFVNTLYLKVLMRDFNANKAKIQALLAEDNFLAKDAAFDNFADAADKSNPFFESDRRQLNTTNNIRCCSDVLNVMSANDPRLKYYFDNNPGGVVSGSPYGMAGDPTETSRLALYATEPVWFSTVDEAQFLKAESYARLGDAANAQAAYEAAVEAAFTRLNIKGADELLAAEYAFVPGSVEAMIEQIVTQKWASNVHGMPWESWFDLNRTGYPVRGNALTDNHGVLDSGYPMRFIYSKTSADYNPNSPEPVAVNVKMWWHK